ncbi:AraC family transcriptional regulator [Bordetella petrii]|nr:AraC family transcriptional regulator [Bordetella petrii]MCD0504229.1 AraC family transcriptional regulator [Bordetella petrii]
MRPDWIRREPDAGGLERIEAYFQGHGYDPHRHATYAIGRTLAGVQSFHYRGALRHSLPGRTIVLHPDEVHDGHAGTEAGFHYRMVYVDPVALQQVMGGTALPFIEGGISADARLYAATQAFVRRIGQRLDSLAQDDALFELAAALQAAGGVRPARHRPDYRAAERARQAIHDTLGQSITLRQLEAASGRDRWSLSRDFRALYGISPSRYVQARRLDWARRLMLAGRSIADAAAQANFADQSHLSRSFRATFGLPPAAWLKMLSPRGA